MSTSRQFSYSRILGMAVILSLIGGGLSLTVQTTASGRIFRAPFDENGYRPSDFSIARPATGKQRSGRLAGGGAWSLLGPPGGDVRDVAVSTNDPNIVLAGISPAAGFGGGLYRSGNGGNTWSDVADLAGISVSDIEFAASGDVYIGTNDSVWKSINGGLTWTEQNLGIGVNDQVLDVALDPSNPSILWAAVADASGNQPINIMRSIDGGASWDNRTPPLGQALSCRAIAVDPGHSNTVIAVFGGSFGGGQVWVTTDGGGIWANRSSGLPNNPMFSVVYDGTRLLVGGGQAFGSQFVGLYSSVNLGANWTPLHNASWPTRVVRDISVDPNDSQKILVATDGTGVYRTINGGTSWQFGIGGTGALSTSSLRFQPGSSTNLFLGTSSLAVFRSTDSGNTFSGSSRGISEIDLYSIHSNPLNPSELAVAFQGQNNGGVYSSVDGGVTWLLEPVPPTRYSAARFAPGGRLYAISSGPSTVAPEGLYRRENNGTWTTLGPDQGSLFESDLDTIRFSLNDPNLILLGGADFGVAGFEGTIWRSTNTGGMWTKVYEFGDSHPITDIEIVENGLDQVMLASYDDQSGDPASVLRTMNGGVSWSPLGSGLPNTSLGEPHLCSLSNNPQAFYLAGSPCFGCGTLYHTTDAGLTWTPTGWTGSAFPKDVACQPGGQTVFLSLNYLQSGGAQVMRSVDGGATFLPFADGLAGVTNPRELAFEGTSQLLLSSGKGSYGADITPSASVNGTVTYGNAIGAPATRFVSNVTVSGAGSPNVVTTTEAPGANAGHYTLTGFGPGSYTVTPAKTGGINSITSFDAAKIAQHVAGINILIGNQFVVADVSGNGTLSSFDAAEVARYVAGINGFGSTASWRFDPANRMYASVTTNISGEDYFALLMGEVSGNWTNTSARPVASRQGCRCQ